MKAKNLIILVAVAIILGGLAYVSLSRKNSLMAPSDVSGQYVLADFQEPDTLNKVERIVFQSPENTITVAKMDDVWVCPEKYNYPVDFFKVRDFVRMASELKVGQPVSADDRQLKRLNLMSPASEQTVDTQDMGTLVKFLDRTDAVMAAMIIGKEHKKMPAADGSAGRGFGGYPDGRYIAAGGKAFLVTETFRDIPDDDKAWLNNDLLNVPSSDILAITVTGPQGKMITLKRPHGGGDFALDGLSDTEESESTKVNGLANVMSYLNFNDVADPQLSDEDTGFDKPTVVVAMTEQGKIYTLNLGGSPEGSSDRYLRLSAVFEPPERDNPPASEDAQKDEKKDPDPVEDKQETNRKAEEEAKRKAEQEKFMQEVREFNQEVAEWTYLVSSYKVDSVSADRDDFVTQKEEEKQDNDEGS